MENSRKEGGFIWIFNFCCSLRILGLFCGERPPGRIFYDQNMMDFPSFFSLLLNPQFPRCFGDFPGWSWVRMQSGELERFPTRTVGASGEGHVACVEQQSVGLLSEPGFTAGGFTVAISVGGCVRSEVVPTQPSLCG